MNRPALFVLIALNSLFITVLATEWYVVTETSIPSVQTKISNSDTEETLPSLDLSEPSEDSYSDLVERPLFIKGRKPVNEPVPENTSVPIAKKTDVFNWELTGIYATPKMVIVFFSRTNAKVAKDNYRKCKLNDEIDGWKVSQIHPDNVILTQAGENKTLPLRKAKPKSPISAQVNTNNNHAVTSSPVQKPLVATPAPQGTPQNTVPPEMTPEFETESSSVETVNTEN